MATDLLDPETDEEEDLDEWNDAEHEKLGNDEAGGGPSGYASNRSDTTRGNDDDSLNPGNKHYKDNAGKKPGSGSGDSRNDLANKESAGDSMYKNGLGGKGGKDIKGTGRLSKAAMAMLPGNLKGIANQFGPTGGIIFILLFGVIGLGGGSTLLASSLLINIKEIFHNDRADATRTNRLLSRAFISNKFDDGKSCKKKTPICTKMTTMSKTQVEQWEKNDFKIEGHIVDKNGNQKGGDYQSSGTAGQEGKGMDDSDRIQITQVTYPDGTTAKDGKTLFGVADAKPSMLRRLETAFATKAAYYTNKFFDSQIIGKFAKLNGGKDQAQAAKEGDDSDAAKQARDDQFNQEGDFIPTKDADKELTQKADSLLDSAIGDAQGKGAPNGDGEQKAKEEHAKGIIGSLIRAVCSTYQVAHLAQNAIKIYHMGQLVKFALLFFRAADQIKDGQGDQSLVWQLADQLTWFQPAATATTDDQKAKVDLTATDSEGYEVAANGSTMGLKSFSQKFLLGGGIGQALSSFTKQFENPVSKIPSTFLPGTSDNSSGRQKMKALCQLTSNPAGQIAQVCAPLITAGQAIFSGVPGIGNIIGTSIVAGTCACTLVDGSWIANLTFCPEAEGLINKIVDKTMEWIAKQSIVKQTMEEVVKSLNVNSDTKGVDAGNAIAAGAGLMLGQTAMGYGQRPSTQTNKNQDITNYIAYTQPLQDEYIALDKQDGKNAPFDPNNQYSLVGTLVRSLNDPNNTTPPSTIFGLFSTLPNLYTTALKMITGQDTAEALYNQPSTAANGASGRYSHCPDANNTDGSTNMDGALGSINITADIYCDPIGVNSVQELNDATRQAYTPGDTTINDLIDWMQANHDQPEGNDANSGTACSKSIFDEASKIFTTGSCDDAGKLASIDDTGKVIANSQYSLYLKYCTDQRQSPYGDQSEPEYTGYPRDQAWYSGAECAQDTLMLRNFRAYTNYCLQSSTMDDSGGTYSESGDTPCSTDATVTAAALTKDTSGVCGLVNNPNITFVSDLTKEGLQQDCQTGQVMGPCGTNITIDPNLANSLNTLSSKYKILINNFGINGDGGQDRCDGGMHTKGKAVDLNEIDAINGASTGKGITYGDPTKDQLLTQFANDFINSANGKARVGQAGCAADFSPTFPGGANGGNFFGDLCNHLHIDVGGG